MRLVSSKSRRTTRLIAICASSMIAAIATVLSSAPVHAVKDPVDTSPPFAAIQWGTACTQIGSTAVQVPYKAPATFDITAGYPTYGYSTTGFVATARTNACRYNFDELAFPPAPITPITSGYCVQWGRGQDSGTGYDPQPDDGSIRNAGYVRWIIANYWPQTNLPAVPSTNATVINKMRSATVAMAIHYFTDGIVMPPNFTDTATTTTHALYDVVAGIVAAALAIPPGSLPPPPPDPTPTIIGQSGGDTATVIGPYVIGANAVGNVTVQVTGGDAFRDAGGTLPFVNGTTLAPGGQLWLRSATPGDIEIDAEGPVVAAIGTMMVANPDHPVQAMFLAEQLVLVGKSSKTVVIVAPPDPPQVTSSVSAAVVEAGASVFDTLNVIGLQEAATLTTTLYGPLAPGAGGCIGADWANAPVSATFGPVSATTSADITTVATRLDAPGCYSYGARLAPLTGGSDLATVPPGTADETLLVIPQVVPPPFDVSSQASANTIQTGGSVSDHVVVAGLLLDRQINLTSALYGPLAPDTAGGCTGVDWLTAEQQLALPVATTFNTVTLNGNGAYDTPSVQLNTTGCYSFAVTVTHNLLTGGEEPISHDLSVPTQVVLVQAPPPEPQPPVPPDPTSPPVPTPNVLPPTGASPAPIFVALVIVVFGAAIVTASRRRNP